MVKLMAVSRNSNTTVRRKEPRAQAGVLAKDFSGCLVLTQFALPFDAVYANSFAI